MALCDDVLPDLLMMFDKDTTALNLQIETQKLLRLLSSDNHKTLVRVSIRQHLLPGSQKLLLADN